MDSITAFHLLVQEAPVVLSILVLCLIIGIGAYRSLAYLSIACFIALLFLFRNPLRIEKSRVSIAPHALLAPADGKIVGIDTQKMASENDYCYKITIITSPLNVYINRIVSDGRMSAIRESTIENAYSTDVEIKGRNARRYMMRQQARTLLNHTVCWVSVGDTVRAGQIYGMVFFGARFELFLPKNVRITVGVGQHIRAGVTVIGYWHSN